MYKCNKILIHILGFLSENGDMINELVAMHCYPSENVLQLLTYCLNPPSLVFPYMDNGTLDDKLRDTWEPLTWGNRAKIALGSARGLRHLHGNEIVHGDIKSNNILLDKHFEPKIGDFGTIALLYNDQRNEVTHKSMAAITGTRHYLPADYLEGTFKRQVRKPVDIYCFGIVLFEMMTGRRPSDEIGSVQRTTMRTFVDNLHNESLSADEVPNDYVADVDRDGICFQITTTNGVCEVRWPYFFYQMGLLCTKKGYKDRPKVEAVHEEIKNVYLCYSVPPQEQHEQRSRADKILKSEIMSGIVMNIS